MVWGCESPELVITESSAFHDRRVKDTDKDSTGQKIDPTGSDQTMDQYRIPQGSLFLEFYCPRSRKENNPIAPRELYSIDASTGEFALDLARMAPAGGGVRMPVWQVAISRSHHPRAPGGPYDNPEDLRNTKPGFRFVPAGRYESFPKPHTRDSRYRAVRLVCARKPSVALVYHKLTRKPSIGIGVGRRRTSPPLQLCCGRSAAGNPDRIAESRRAGYSAGVSTVRSREFVLTPGQVQYFAQ